MKHRSISFAATATCNHGRSSGRTFAAPLAKDGFHSDASLHVFDEIAREVDVRMAASTSHRRQRGQLRKQRVDPAARDRRRGRAPGMDPIVAQHDGQIDQWPEFLQSPVEIAVPRRADCVDSLRGGGWRRGASGGTDAAGRVHAPARTWRRRNRAARRASTRRSALPSGRSASPTRPPRRIRGWAVR